MTPAEQRLVNKQSLWRRDPSGARTARRDHDLRAREGQAVACPAPTTVRCKLPRTQVRMRYIRVTTMDVPFELVENQLVAGITIGGRGPFACLLDTAVAPSVVDLALARELGLAVRDDVPGEAAGQGSEGGTFYPSELPEVWLGELEVGDVEAVAADLSRLGSKLNRPLHAILGQSFFEGRVVQLDYRNRRVRLDPHGFERGLRADIEGAADLTPVVTVQVNAASVPVVLDTGSSLTLGIYVESVEQLGLARGARTCDPAGIPGRARPHRRLRGCRRLARARRRSAQSGRDGVPAPSARGSDPRARQSRQRVSAAHPAHARLPTARALHRRCELTRGSCRSPRVDAKLRARWRVEERVSARRRRGVTAV